MEHNIEHNMEHNIEHNKIATWKNKIDQVFSFLDFNIVVHLYSICDSI